MSFLNKNYTFVKQENLEEFFKLLGLPSDGIEKLLKVHPDQKITKDGDTYTIHTVTPDGPKATQFKSGVEFDDTLGPAKTLVKTTYVVDGNTVTQTNKTPKIVMTIKREYSGNDLLITITADKWDGVAKVCFKA